MNIRFPQELLALAPGDDFERRSRLIAVVYEVLQNVETPAIGATDIEMCSVLSRAFADKATDLANLRPPRPR